MPSARKRDSARASRRGTTTCSPSASSRSASQDPTNPLAPVTRTGIDLAAGYGGEDRDLVAVLDGRVEPVEEADVLAGHVDVHEAAQVAVLRDPLAQAV